MLARWFSSFRQEFDPLDREILERAFDVAWATAKERGAIRDRPRKLTAMLRSNLIEIAQTKRFSDAEALLDVLMDRLTPAKL